MESYIGATGFTEPGQVTRALQTVPERSDRKFMVGVRASAMSLWSVPHTLDTPPKEATL